MKIIYKEYDSKYYAYFENCMIGLQDYLMKIDPLKRLRMLRGFGKKYAEKTLKLITKNNGKIFLAFIGKEIAGCIVGIIEKQPKEELFECIPTLSGRVQELFIFDKFRSLGIGKELMKKMEEYFISKRCSVIRVEVFKPNT